MRLLLKPYLRQNVGRVVHRNIIPQCRFICQVPSKAYFLSMPYHNSIPFLTISPSFPSEFFHKYAQQLGIFWNVVDVPDQEFLWSMCQRKLRRLPFLNVHFDHVITGYREISVSDWKMGFDPQIANENAQRVEKILNPCYHLLHEFALAKNSSTPQDQWLPVHILELNTKGTIAPHVDHLTVLALCLIAGLEFCIL